MDNQLKVTVLTYVTHLIFNIDRPLLTPSRGPRSCPNHELCQTDQALFNMAVVATSEIVTREVEVAVIDCEALFYEEGKGGENYRKKNKFRCRVNKDENGSPSLGRALGKFNLGCFIQCTSPGTSKRNLT